MLNHLSSHDEKIRSFGNMLRNLTNQHMHDNAGDIVKVFGIDRVSAAQPAYFAAGSDAYAPALAVYQFTKLHHETKGALEDSLNDLGRRFAHQGKRATPAPSSPTPEDPPV